MDIRAFRRLYGGFQAARVVLTANSIGVFDALAKRPRTSAEAARTLKTDPRATELLLNALAGVGLLAFSDGRYGNGPAADRWLVRGRPEYQGDILRHAETMWRNWSALEEVVKSGRPANRGFDHEAFIMGMHNLSVLKARKVLGAIGLRGVRRALDLGGGPGTYSIEMARRGIGTTLFDLPETVAIARRVARAERVKGIRFLGGDFHSGAIGRGYDLVFVSQILHAYSEADNRALLAKCRAALAPGGRVAVQEFPLNEDRTGPPQGALFAINMLVATEGGRTYSPGEITSWLKDAGFRRVALKPEEDYVLLIARTR